MRYFVPIAIVLLVLVLAVPSSRVLAQECLTATSSPNPNDFQVIYWPDGAPIGAQLWILDGDYFGYTFTRTGGPGSTFVGSDVSDTDLDLVANGVEYTLTSHTTFIFVWDTTEGSPTTFDLEMCPSPVEATPTETIVAVTPSLTPTVGPTVEEMTAATATNTRLGVMWIFFSGIVSMGLLVFIAARVRQ